jgi:hypothetical protein
MNLDPRIIEAKKPLTPFDNNQAVKFNGKPGYFSCVADDFSHLKNAAYGNLELAFGERPYCFTDENGERHACTYFLPKDWVRKEFDRYDLIDSCYRTKGYLADLVGRQNRLLQEICDTTYGFDNPGDKSMIWHMRDILMDAYTMYKECLEDFEKGNY